MFRGGGLLKIEPASESVLVGRSKCCTTLVLPKPQQGWGEQTQFLLWEGRVWHVSPPPHVQWVAVRVLDRNPHTLEIGGGSKLHRLSPTQLPGVVAKTFGLKRGDFMRDGHPLHLFGLPSAIHEQLATNPWHTEFGYSASTTRVRRALGV